MAVMFNFWSQVYIRFYLFCVYIYVCVYIYFNYTLLSKIRHQGRSFRIWVSLLSAPRGAADSWIVDTRPVFRAQCSRVLSPILAHLKPDQEPVRSGILHETNPHCRVSLMLKRLIIPRAQADSYNV